VDLVISKRNKINNPRLILLIVNLNPTVNQSQQNRQAPNISPYTQLKGHIPKLQIMVEFLCNFLLGRCGTKQQFNQLTGLGFNIGVDGLPVGGRGADVDCLCCGGGAGGMGVGGCGSSRYSIPEKPT